MAGRHRDRADPSRRDTSRSETHAPFICYKRGDFPNWSLEQQVAAAVSNAKSAARGFTVALPPSALFWMHGALILREFAG